MDWRVFQRDPVRFVKWLWPNIVLYNKQRDVLNSLVTNDETYVPAANMMGS